MNNNLEISNIKIAYCLACEDELEDNRGILICAECLDLQCDQFLHLTEELSEES